MSPRFVVTAIALLALGGLFGVLGTQFLGSGSGSGVGSGPAGSGEAEILYWVAPMDPNFRSDSPGKSPMGMDLIPVYAGDEAAGGDDEAIRISPAVENNIGVRTAPVRREDFHRQIVSVGYVRPVDDAMSVVDIRSEGWIEELRVAAVGDAVAAGDLLFRMHAPDLVAAQSEYLQARRIGRAGLTEAAQQRLRTLGMTLAQIDAVARAGQPRRLTAIYARRGGVVTEMTVREGSRVEPGDTVMTIADLSTVWVVADLFEDEARGVEPGMPVTMRSPARPGRLWTGEVDYIYPTVDRRSRTIAVRMRVANHDGALRPDSYVNVEIETEPRTGVLTVPREAVIRTGRSDRVILALGDGRYRPARVVIGTASDGRIEILEGVAENERVVVSSQFLIDSEASLRGMELRMSPPGAVEELSEPAPPAEVAGTGVVESVMAGHGMIDLRHEPIPQIGWPAMSMSFTAGPAVDLSGLSPGDTVDFTLSQDAREEWLITDIKRAESAPSRTGDGPDPHAGHRP